MTSSEIPPTHLDATDVSTSNQEGRTIAGRAVRGTAFIAATTYFNILIGFSSNLILTRLLSPTTFGFFSMANFWASLFIVRPKFGLSFPAVRHKTTDSALLGTFLGLNLIISLITVALSGAAILILSRLGYEQEIVGGVITLMLVDSVTALSTAHGLVLDKALLLSQVALITIIGTGLAYILAISLAWLSPGIWSLVVIPAVPSIVTAVGVYWLARRLVPEMLEGRWQFNWPLAQQLLWQGLPTGLSISAVAVFASQFDNFLIGTFVDYTTLGYYDRAYRMAHWSNVLLTTVVARTAFVTFAKVHDDPPRLTHAVRLSLWLLTTLGIPIGLTVFLGASDLILVLYGPKWSESAFYLRFLVICAMAGPIVDLGFWLSAALGHTRVTVLITTMQSLTLIIFATPLTIHFGVMGTISGVGITTIAALSVSCYYVFRQVALQVWITLGLPILGAVIATGTFVIVAPYWIDNSLPVLRLIITGTIIFSVFGLTLLVLHPTEMIERVKYTWQTLHQV